ncbi:MAG: protein kinase [Nannocystaceae bacterium]
MDRTVRFGADATVDEREIELPRDRLIDGRYRVLDRIGDGGMGVVLRAHDERLDREVALKLIRPVLMRERELVDQFLAEARAMAQLRHANVVEVYDYGEHEHLPYFAMRLVRGPDLHTWVDSQPHPLPVDVAIGIFAQVCEGVAAIHDAGVVHRDIKPENMLVESGFRVVVTDFGLVQPLHERLGVGTTPTFQVTGGTASYMAPELAREDELDGGLAARADVYALGIMAYWLLVGRHPFVASSRRDMLKQQIFARPMPPSEVRHDLPRELDPVVLEALHKDPRQRPADARRLAERLRTIRLGLSRPRARITVVDEDAASTRFIEQALREALPDVELELLSRSDQALDRIEASPPALVITALENRGISGMELAASLRGNRVTEAVPILVVSSVGGAPEWKALWHIGVQGFLLKPLVRESFVPLVRGLLPQALARTRAKSTREVGSISR